MTISQRLQQSIENSASDTIIGICVDADSACNFICDLKTDPRNILRQLIWVFLHHTIQVCSIFCINFYCKTIADSVLGQIKHCLTQLLFILYLNGNFSCFSLTDAFNFCKRMETIVIPSTVESIGNRAFMDCIALKSVYFKGDAPLIGAYPFHSYLGFVGVEELRVLPELTLYYPYFGANWWEPEWHGYPTEAWSGAFVDVDYNEYYMDAVLWAVDEGITNGTGELRFSPNLGCTRGQIVTFLWRAAGCPEPESTDNPFTDVRKKDYYYKAVLWAVEQGITKGMGKGRFAPNETCTRAQAVTFLWRFDGKPDFSDYDTDFADVPENSYYEQAIIWAYWYDITNGVDSDHFAPNEECTRGQIVTFLYRYMT